MRPATSIVPIDGACHTRILSDPHTLQVVADFVTRRPFTSNSAA
jgi:hypothetical protein